ncbi:hypothetical protein Tco_0456197 [Tanacetum coccineum]
MNEEKVENYDFVLPKYAIDDVKSRYDNTLVGYFVGKSLACPVVEIMLIIHGGRISFARTLIEVNSGTDLKKEVVMAIPNEEGNGYTKEVIRVDYDWKPPHCVECKTFGHGLTQCPKRVKEAVPNAPSLVATDSTTVEDHNEGFIEVKGRKNKGKKADSKSRPISGFDDRRESSPSHVNHGTNTTPMSNSFDALNKVVEEEDVVV